MKKILTALFILTLILPASVSALSVDELQKQISILLAQIETLRKQISQQSGQNCAVFSSDLQIGNSGSSVYSLHKVLIKEGFDIDAGEVSSNNFGESTASAVVGFQEKYRYDVLSPSGLLRGTGYVGARTRTKLNSLGCNSHSTISTNTTTQTYSNNMAQTKTIPAPIISSINTVHGGPAKVGDLINLYGSNFNSNSSILINGGIYSAPVIFSSASVVSFIVPSNVSLGTHTIQFNSNTSGLSNTVNLTITAPATTILYPTISSINTATGAAPRVGDMVDVFGTNFTPNSGISIDGLAEPYSNIAQFVSPTLINFIIPSNLSIGSHKIEVYTPINSGGALVSNAVNINVASQ